MSKKMVWIVTAWFRDFENTGYSEPSEIFFADTYPEAEKMKQELLDDPEYEDVWISDVPEEREFYS